jgi:uncharacterized NAD(P)/FAD-binding protein YdhS
VSDAPYSVAVVGAGFTGSMVATHLLRDPRLAGARLALVERTGRFTAGVAYGTEEECHTLNVPAGRMSAFAGDADHFLRFARTLDPGVAGGSFVPRRLYASYLASVLDEAESASAATLDRVAATVTSVERTREGALRVELANAAPLVARRVVLAIGNFPPADPPVADRSFYADPRYARDPWAPGALDTDPDAPVLLIGTGLTMLDVALALRNRGRRAPIEAVSRHGLLPQPHRESAVAPAHQPPPADLDTWPRTTAGLLRRLRAEVDRAAEAGIDWREVHTSLRAGTPALWQSLPEAERDRFLRHARPYWETHRHRSSPQTAAAIETMLADRTLRVTAGRVLAHRPDAANLRVVVRPRDGSPDREIVAGRVVNCTGPDTDVQRVDDPLVQSLLAQGTAVPDPLGLGLRTTADGELVDSGGEGHGDLFLVGPLRKGLLWENTAVPELRVEAERLAGRLAGLEP